MNDSSLRKKNSAFMNTKESKEQWWDDKKVHEDKAVKVHVELKEKDVAVIGAEQLDAKAELVKETATAEPDTKVDLAPVVTEAKAGLEMKIDPELVVNVEPEIKVDVETKTKVERTLAKPDGVEMQYVEETVEDEETAMLASMAAFQKLSNMVTIRGEVYKLEEFIAEGGFGAVYKAIRQKTNIEVAIKLIVDAQKSNETDSNYQTALHEVEIFTLLKNSKNVIDILAWDAKGSNVVTVMEYCPWTLHDYRDEYYDEGITSNATRREFILFFLQAIQEMRKYDITLFDMKPRNIMLCDGVWKVNDFNAAQIVQDGKEGFLTSYGSRGWTDPRRKDDRHSYADSDLYSVGSILHFLFAGIRYAEVDSVQPLPNDEEAKVQKFLQKLLDHGFTQFDDFYHESKQLVDSLESATSPVP